MRPHYGAFMSVYIGAQGYVVVSLVLRAQAEPSTGLSGYYRPPRDSRSGDKQGQQAEHVTSPCLGRYRHLFAIFMMLQYIITH